ncbi:protein-glutamate O-methyltransferase CheR [Parapedobacter defluvii]|uniref:CheR family methyltransferase n=1 Tax=Parapedobacter defluvii TaxID=2045106 RepID=UPI00333F288F
MSLSFENLEELIELVNHVHGFDLNGYSRASLKRRVSRILDLYRLDFRGLKHNLINTSGFFYRFLGEITVNVTEMFRDPLFYVALREEVFPYLATFPHIKIWSAGCSTGEEVYSLAILLKKQNLYDRSFIYGTDINSKVLETAKQGIFDLGKMKVYSDNYLQTGCDDSFSDYYTAGYGAAAIHHDLRKNILFSIHNLVSDGVFNEFQLITCRNVLIYFDTALQERVFNLLYESLALFGFLGLGSKETLRSEHLRERFRLINKKQNIYQKIA